MAESSSQDIQNIWGILIPILPGRFRPIILNKTTFTFGRLPTCDFVASKQKDELSEVKFMAVSKTHFIISNSDERTFIEDQSLCGTYINGQKVGKGHTIEIQEGAIISLFEESFKIFRFMKVRKD